MLEFKPGAVSSGCLPCAKPPKLVALRTDCVSLVPVTLASLAKVCMADGRELMLLPAPCSAGDGGKFCVGSPGERDAAAASAPGNVGGEGIYIVFRTSRRPRTVPVLRAGICIVLRVFATLSCAALDSSGSSSAIGLFCMLSLNSCSCSSPASSAASLCAWEIGSFAAGGIVNPSSSLAGSPSLLRCDGGGPGGGGASKISSAVIPLRPVGAVRGGAFASETSACVPLVAAVSSVASGFGNLGVSGASVNASSLPVEMARLLADAWGERRPWLLDARLKGPEFLPGESWPKPPWTLCLRRPSIVPIRLRSLFSAPVVSHISMYRYSLNTADTYQISRRPVSNDHSDHRH